MKQGIHYSNFSFDSFSNEKLRPGHYGFGHYFYKEEQVEHFSKMYVCSLKSRIVSRLTKKSWNKMIGVLNAPIFLIHHDATQSDEIRILLATLSRYLLSEGEKRGVEDSQTINDFLKTLTRFIGNGINIDGIYIMWNTEAICIKRVCSEVHESSCEILEDA